MRAQNDLEFATATKVAAMLDSAKRRHRVSWHVRLLQLIWQSTLGSSAHGFQKRGLFWRKAPGLFVLAALFAASFWVGMAVDLVLGLKILGFGVAGVVGCYVLWVLVLFVLRVRKDI